LGSLEKLQLWRKWKESLAVPAAKRGIHPVKQGVSGRRNPADLSAAQYPAATQRSCIA